MYAIWWAGRARPPSRLPPARVIFINRSWVPELNYRQGKLRGGDGREREEESVDEKGGRQYSILRGFWIESNIFTTRFLSVFKLFSVYTSRYAVGDSQQLRVPNQVLGWSLIASRAQELGDKNELSPVETWTSKASQG